MRGFQCPFSCFLRVILRISPGSPMDFSGKKNGMLQKWHPRSLQSLAVIFVAYRFFPNRKSPAYSTVTDFARFLG
jgi:hypothetical protein